MLVMSPEALKAPTCAAGSMTGGALDSAESRLNPVVSGCLMPSMLARNDPLEVIVTSLVPKMPAEMLCRISAPSEVVVMLTDAVMQIEANGAVSEVRLSAGQSYQRPSGIEHDVMNGADKPMAFVEIEIKQPGALA